MDEFTVGKVHKTVANLKRFLNPKLVLLKFLHFQSHSHLFAYVDLLNVRDPVLEIARPVAAAVADVECAVDGDAPDGAAILEEVAVGAGAAEV